MADKDNTLLKLNGVQYRLALVIQNAKSGPKIVVKEEDLYDLAQTEIDVTTEPVSDSRDAADIIFFKHQGKFMAITGKNFIVAARARENFKGEHHGHLISSVNLKNAKYTPPAPAIALESEAIRPVRNYDPAYANRPRMDDRTSRYAGSGPAKYPSTYRGNK